MQPVNQIPDNKNEKAFSIIDDIIKEHNFSQPFIIGITGAGGAGKTTFGNNIAQWYGFNNSLSIDLDDYLISREERKKQNVTGYNPIANNLLLARKNILSLQQNEEIKKPRYNHKTGEHMLPEQITPKPLIIVEGVTTLYDELKDIYNIAIFMDALEETQMKSRIERDVKKRGYSREEALELFEKVKPDYEKFIEPTKKFSDVTFLVNTEYVMQPIEFKNRLENFNR